MIVNPKNLTAISQLPGIKAIHPMHPKYPSATFSDIDFLKARTASGPAGPWNSGVLMVTVSRLPILIVAWIMCIGILAVAATTLA